MEETYTFSRALHLMRYGGKKMMAINWHEGEFLYVRNEELYDQYHVYTIIGSWDIMHEWIEVK